MSHFLKFWQIDRTVFLRPVEPEQVYFTEKTRAELERLLLLARQPQTVSFLIGSKGSGKSTYVKWLAAQFPVETHEILVTTMITTEQSEGWLARRLAEFMGTKGRPIPSEDLLRHVVARLDELVDEKRNLLVLIDAAQMAASPRAWQELATLMSLQALTEPCVSFVLAGDPSLLQMFLEAPELSTMISFAVELPPLTENDTANYLQHRLQLASIKAEIEPEAIALIFEESRGVIARINAIAENCLIECSLRETSVINRDIANAAKHYIAGKPSIVPTPQVSSGGLLKPLSALYKTATAKQNPPSELAITIADSGKTPQDSAGAPPADSPDPSLQTKESNGIKLASLFKSDASRRR